MEILSQDRKGKFLAWCAILVIVYIGFSFVFNAYADPPGSPYSPGATLSPTCVPDSSNCTVYPPLFSSSTLPVGGVLFVNDATGTITANTSTLYWNASATMFQVGQAPGQSSTSTLLLLGPNLLSGGNQAGTFLGINATSGLGADFVNFQSNSSTLFQISSSGAVVANEGAGAKFQILASAVPIDDLFFVANSPGTAVTANGVNDIQADYYGGSGAVESDDIRLNMTAGPTSGSVWNALRIFENTSTQPGVTIDGAKFDPLTGGVGLSNALYVGNGWRTALLAMGVPLSGATSSLIQLGSTTIQNGNVSGTYIGSNPFGFSGDFINFQSNSSTVFDVASSGAVTIGTSTHGLLPGSLLTLGTSSRILSFMNSGNIVGNLMNPVTTGTPLSVVGQVTGLNGAFGVAVAGRYAYITSNSANTMSVVDISSPINPTLIATTSVGSFPVGIAVTGRYVYVVSNIGNTLSVIDISNPKLPTVVSTLPLGGPYSVAVSGRYVYVANFTSSTVVAVDVSNPSSPTIVSSLTTGGGPISISLYGRYLYVANKNSSTISVVDTTNPKSIAQVGSLSLSQTPQSVYTSGRYVYAGVGSTTLSVIDVSNPAIPAQVATTTVGGNPYAVFAAGRYAYVVNNGSSSVSVVDVSNATATAQVGLVGVGTTPNGISVSGRYAYVTNSGSNSVSIIDISGTETNGMNAASGQFGTLQVTNDIIGTGQLQIFGSETLAGSLFVSTTGTPSAFAGGLTIGAGNATTTALITSTSSLIVCARTNCTIGAAGTSTSAVAWFASVTGATTGGSIAARGTITGGLADVGEFIPVVGTSSDYSQGEVISVSATSTPSFRPSSGTYDSNLAGVITTTAGLIAGGGEDGHGSNVIALAGRVPVTVNMEGGQIHTGDLLTSSAASGIAMRSVAPGRIIGIALADDLGDVSNPEATSQVMMFVNAGWSLGNLVDGDQIASSSWALATNGSGQAIIDQFTAYIRAALAKLGIVIQNGIIVIQNLVAHKVSTDELCVDGTCITGSQFSALVHGFQGSGGPSAPVLTSAPSAPAAPATTTAGLPLPNDSSTIPSADSSSSTGTSLGVNPLGDSTDSGGQ